MIVLESGIGNYVSIRDKQYSYFGGNNYLGLASHPAVKEAAIEAIRKYGVNFSASRRTTGTAEIHLELEKQLSLFKGKDDTVTFASGYQGNGILLDILKDKYSVVMLDEYAHPSILSGIPPEKRVIRYKHLDTTYLSELFDKMQGAATLVITDGVFAITGEIAPLDRIFALTAAHNSLLIVDDAHSTGILGKTGKGTPEHFNIDGNDIIFQSETMSKALGSYGGFISGNNTFITSIRERSTTYQASTALTPAVAAAAIASLKIIRDHPSLHIQLLQKTKELRNEITGIGFQTLTDNTPIVPLFFKSSDEASNLSAFLEEHSIIVPLIIYPVNQELNILRIAITAGHSSLQIEQLLEMLKKWRVRDEKNQYH